MAAKNSDLNELRDQIIASLDIPYEYSQMGLRLASDKPRSSGKMEAYSMTRDERKPSAWIDANTGMYGDSGPGGESGLSIFDFAIKYGGHVDFKSAFAHFAEKAGVDIKKKKRKRREEKPEDKLEFQEWDDGNDILATMWCVKHKQGVTLESVKAAGGKIAFYPCWKDKETGERKRGSHKCIAVPCYVDDVASAEPVAWVLYDLHNQKFKVFRGDDQEPDYVKMKSIGPTRGAMMGRAGLERLAGDRNGIELVWKTAGPSDMLALMAAIPEDKRGSHVVVCNASGETGDVLPNNIDLFVGVKAAVLHDADDAGELGAVKWCLPLHSVSQEVRHVRLPYDVTQKGGKDFRDFVAEGNNYDSLLTLYNAAKPYEPPAEPGHGDGKPEISMAAERQIVGMIQLDVLGETDRGGVKVFSEFHRKADVITDIGRLTFENLARIAGPRVRECVMLSSRDEKPGMVPLQAVKNAIALLSGYRRIGEQTELGAGCWSGMTEEGIAYPSVVMVNNGEAAEWNGTKQLERIDHPRFKEQLLDFESAQRPWYRFDHLKQCIENCDRDFATDTMNEAIQLFDKFRWKHSAAPFTTTGLVLASWVQSLWDWRPQIAVIGPSASGKSTLFGVLARIFGNLARKSSSSSAAGLRQVIKRSSQVILFDEFENSQYRKEVLEMLRMSSRGDTMLRGTTSHQAQQFQLRHIAWVAAIEAGLNKTPDRNRFIMLELERRGTLVNEKLELPSARELASLGQRLLAVAVRYAFKACRLANQLKEHRITGVDDRVIENYAVPTAMLSTIKEFNYADAVALLTEMLHGAEEQHERMSDEMDLLEDILNSRLANSPSRLAMWQLVQIVLTSTAISNVTVDQAKSELDTAGLRFSQFTKNDALTLKNMDLEGQRCLIISCKAVSRHLLTDDAYAGVDVSAILKRLPVSLASRRQTNLGNDRSCIVVGLNTLAEAKDELLFAPQACSGTVGTRVE